MNSPKTAAELLDMAYLHMRSALLETAAAFDRIDATDASGALANDPRLRAMREAALTVAGPGPNRVRRILETLSVK